MTMDLPGCVEGTVTETVNTPAHPGTAVTIGSLFSGIGGLDLAVEQFFGADMIWHCELDDEPAKILAARWPGVPNLGDITKVDWNTVTPVDILCGGFPCQDLSLSGRRSGMRPGTRSGLWSDFRAAIEVLKPKVVVIENVRGLLSGCAESDSDMEPCPGCLGVSKQHRPSIRALGRVLGDLAGLGFDAEWCAVRASDVGAPHERFRVFVVAYASGVGHEWSGNTWDWRPRFEDDHRGNVRLLPTPTASNPNEEEDLDVWLKRRERVKAEKKNGNGFGTPLGVAVRLLKTPLASETAKATFAPFDEVSGHQEWLTNQIAVVHRDQRWGEYEPAVRRWEACTRDVPPPTRADGRSGAHRLSPLLTEWMMGYPEGWVTDILDRNPAIKACGNGVVPQQAFHALTILWGRVLEHIRGTEA